MPSVYPAEQQIHVGANGTVYVKNLKIMLASDLYNKDGEKVRISKCPNPPPDGWWASEKWDGIRALWDGEKFISRGSGRSYPKVYSYVPDTFKQMLPSSVALDGELWIARNQFNKVSALSNLLPGGKYTKSQIDDIWNGNTIGKPVVYKVFDTPSFPNKTFKERYEILEKLIDDIKSKYPSAKIQLTKQIEIKNEEHMNKLYCELIRKGAEGLILKNPNSLYEPKRSKQMLKYKVHNDAEGIVIGHNPGTGRLEGTLGSLEIEVLDQNGKLSGIITSVGTGFTDKERTLDPDSEYFIPKGTIINFRYMEMAKDSVRHPVFRGVRSD